MMNTSTGQFHVSNMGQQFEAGSAVVRGNVLYYLLSGGDGQVKVDTCDVADLRAGNVGSVTANRAWSSFDLSSRVPKTKRNGAGFLSAFRPAAVLLRQTIYFFWADAAARGQVYAISMDEAGALSTSPYKVYTRSGSDDTPLQAASYLAASVAPNGTDIVLNWFDPGANKREPTRLRSLSLDPRKIRDDDRRWVGAAGSALKPSEHGLSAVDSSYFRVSTAWFTQGGKRNFMIASFFSSNDQHVYFLLYPIDRDGTPAAADSGNVLTINDLTAKQGFTMSRDPAGRIHAIYCDDDFETNVVTRDFNTNQGVQKDKSGKDPELAWGPKANLNGMVRGSEKAPVMAFVAGVPSASSVTVPTSGNETGTFPGTDIPQYGFAFYANHNPARNRQVFDVQCQVAFYGTSSVIPGYQTIVPKPTYADNRLLTILLDTFPFPDQNLGAAVSPNRRILEYTYGASSATELSAMSSAQSLYGVKAAFTTTAGVGPAAEAEYRAGPQGAYASTTTETQSTGYSVDTTPITVSPGPPPRYKIEAHGEYFGTTPSAFHETIAIFRDAAGSIVSGDEAPLFSTITPVLGSETTRVSGEYGTYCYTPGDIFSYGQREIDAKMKDLYQNLSDGDKPLFSPGYASGYVENVIIPNALTLADGKKFVEFTVGASGGSSTTFQSISEVVATNGILVKGTAYAGVSGGSKLSLFGLIEIEGFSASALVGNEYELSVTGGVGGTKTWGISFTNNAPTAVSGAYGYTVKMYICRPSPLWAREVQFFAADVVARPKIDFDDSIPSKIMFVVSNIQETLPPRLRKQQKTR